MKRDIYKNLIPEPEPELINLLVKHIRTTMNNLGSCGSDIKLQMPHEA